MNYRLIAACVVAVLAFASAAALGADPRAAFPLGDGGLFQAVVAQILAAGFAYPQHVAYNLVEIPFAYSPLAFYALAAIVKVTGAEIPRAMNLWVIGWDALIAPAAYLAARRFLCSRVEALVATAFLIVFPGNFAWLGMGGALTRGPGYVCFLIAAGYTWSAFGKERRPHDVAVAGVAAAATAWFHMEFAFLYAATFVVFAIFARPSLRPALTIAALATALALPWLALASGQLSAFTLALGTSHGPAAVGLPLFLAYFGILGGGSWLALTGCLCAIAACFVERRYVWLVWIVVLIALDSRAGQQAAHLPSALAIGWAGGYLWRALQPDRAPAAILLLAIAFLAAVSSARAEVAAFVRLQPADARDMAWLGEHTPADAWIVSLFPGATHEIADRDQTYEWLPALGDRRSPLVYQGLEWVSHRDYLQRIYNLFDAQACVSRGAACVTAFVRDRIPAGDPAYVYVPAHGDAYSSVVAGLRADPHFSQVYSTETSTTFRVTDR